MKICVGDLRRIIREAAGNEWIVRGGQQLLFRRVDEPKDAWRYSVFPKVMYFSDVDIYMKPQRNVDRQNWTFRYGEFLVSVDEDQFYKKPDVQIPGES